MIEGLLYLPNFDPRTMKLHVIIVSDFLQNVPAFSQYTDIPLSYEEFKKTPYAQNLNIDLKGVEVTLVFVRNSKASRFQNPAQRAFWHDLIEDKVAIDTSTGGRYE